MKDDLLKAYAKLSKDYERHVDLESGFNARYERPAMMNLLPSDLQNAKVLDAGCAAGWYSEQLARRGASVTAVDLSPEMVEACKRRVGEFAEVFVCDLTVPLPFEDEAFDLIVSSLTLHYLDDWAPTFREFRRVLKPGGMLLYSVNHPFMDARHFDRPDYFAHERIVDTWNKKEAGRVEVPFYRRPMCEIVNATTATFRLEQLIEPRPIRDESGGPELQVWNERWYDHLSRNPHFMIVQARKA